MKTSKRAYKKYYVGYFDGNQNFIQYILSFLNKLVLYYGSI